VTGFRDREVEATDNLVNAVGKEFAGEPVNHIEFEWSTGEKAIWIDLTDEQMEQAAEWLEALQPVDAISN
jgi:hypothetical protein